MTKRIALVKMKDTKQVRIAVRTKKMKKKNQQVIMKMPLISSIIILRQVYINRPKVQ